MKAIHLDDIEPTSVGGTLWKPIRSTLDVRAFGINAYVAQHAGDPLFAEHDETEAGAGNQRHQELYVVLSGRATFRGAGRAVDARAGTIVFFEDPAERRSAEATEAGTTILAIGAPVGEGYEIAPWEYWFWAQRAGERGETERARAIAEAGLEQHPDDARLRELAQRSAAED
jgi:hypothetical protein